MLKDRIVKLYELELGKYPSNEIQNRIIEILEENDLVQKGKIPAWFIEFLDSLISGRPKERTFYTYHPSKGDIANFIAELEEIIDAEWNDYGEAVEVYFPNIGLSATISTEGDFYKVK